MVADDDASEVAEDAAASQESKLPFVVDPVTVFGRTTSFAYPSNFAKASDLDAFLKEPLVGVLNSLRTFSFFLF